VFDLYISPDKKSLYSSIHFTSSSLNQLESDSFFLISNSSDSVFAINTSFGDHIVIFCDDSQSRFWLTV